jgi:hypothetical protein
MANPLSPDWADLVAGAVQIATPGRCSFETEML